MHQLLWFICLKIKVEKINKEKLSLNPRSSPLRLFFPSMMRSTSFSFIRSNNNSFLLIVLPILIISVLSFSIILIVSIITIISIIGSFLIAFLIPVSIFVILLIVLSYLSGNILYFSVFFDDYSQKVMILKFLRNVSNLPYCGVEDVYQFVLNILSSLRKYSSYVNRRRGSRNINMFRVFLDESYEREENFIFAESLHNIFSESDGFVSWAQNDLFILRNRSGIWNINIINLVFSFFINGTLSFLYYLQLPLFSFLFYFHFWVNFLEKQFNDTKFFTYF